VNKTGRGGRDSCWGRSEEERDGEGMEERGRRGAGLSLLVGGGRGVELSRPEINRDSSGSF